MSGMLEVNVSAGPRTTSAPALRQRQTGALLRPLLWVIGALALLAALLLSVLTWGPNLMRETIAARTSRMLGRTVSVGHIDVSVFSGRAALSNVQIDSLEPGRPMLSVKKLTLEINPWAYAHGAVVVRSIDLDTPRARVVRVAPDRIDLSDVIDEFTNRPASLRRTDWQVDRVAIHDGSLDFDDRVVRKLSRIESLELLVEGLTNKESAATQAARLQSGFKLDGRPARIDAEATLFSESPQAKVQTRLDALPLASVRPYLTLPASIHPASGQITFDLQGVYSPKTGKPAQTLQIEGSVALNEPRITDESGAQRFAAKSLSARIAPSFPLGGALHLSQLQLLSPQLDSGRNSAGVLVWPSMSKANGPGESNQGTRPQQPSGAGGPSSLKIDTITLDAGSVRWSDAALAAPLDLKLEPLSLSAGPIEIPSLANPQAIRGHASLQASVDGGEPIKAEVDLEGTVGKALVSFDQIPLARYAPLAGPGLRARVEQGWLKGDARLQWDSAQGSWSVNDANAALSDVRLRHAGKQTASIGLLTAQGIQIDPAARRIELAATTLAQSSLVLTRDAKGRFDAQDWYVDDAVSANASARSTQSATNTALTRPWDLLVKQAEIKGFDFEYRDPKLSRDNALPKVRLDARASQLTLDPKRPVPFEASASLSDGARLSARGKLRPAPLDVDANVRVSRLTIAYADPYLDPYLNLTLARGQLNGGGQVRVNTAADGSISRLGFEGELSANDFNALDKLTRDDFLRWRALTMPSIKVDWKPAQLADSVIDIGNVAFVDFYARVILSAQGRLNLADVTIDPNRPSEAKSLTEAPELRPLGQPAPVSGGEAAAVTTAEPGPTPTPTRKAPAAQAAGPQPKVKVGTIQVSGGNVNFTDLFIRPNYTANLTQLQGSIDALASDRLEPSAVMINGRVDDDTPLEITGRIRPLTPVSLIDLRGIAKGFDLPKLSPYSARWAGYAIEKGKLTADVSYHIEGEALKADNKLTINQLTFGEKVESPDAFKVPVLLAVSLLKDRNGNIDLDLPISGTLSDPQFSVGGLIWRAIGNLIVKVVTSPFTLLSSLGSADQPADVSLIEFDAGASNLDDDDRKRLDTLANGLEQRPGLSLEIAGYADPVSDRSALQHAQLDRALKGAKLGQMRRANRTGELPSVDSVVIEPQERAALLEQLWRAAKLSPSTFAKAPSAQEMEEQLLERTRIDSEDVTRLAQARADVARTYLRETKGIEHQRLYLLAPRLSDATENLALRRVAFQIK